ncbi:glycosyltransferase [Marinobacter sp. CHS3-4]|uniref:glycosyltransferase n=1 Tax=Marinobacter sp. CHS3-4 TaxID=3045174 RepID=UPI0024B4E414|nr:glycosyltransferase [Marinobacter sp. CHS3-4]MDI9245606.1 glycosyltransferase [Marinobacter sp. CHS3-4]
MANSDLSDVLFLVPGDPGQKTGGYRYVARLVEALNEHGVNARVAGLDGRFPIPDKQAREALNSALSDCPDEALVVLDGLAMGGLPDTVCQHADRLALWSLVHHPLADETGLAQAEADWLFEAERRGLAAVKGVLVTSRHTANRLQAFEVTDSKIHVVEPGSDTVSPQRPETVQRGRSSTIQLLCVATLSQRKAQHQLVEALCQLRHLDWHCSLVGSVARKPAYAEKVRRQIRELNLEDRFTLTGELGDQALAEHYARADCFVLPSLYEGYGMVVDEALSTGLPVISSDGGALANTGDRPGVLLYAAGSVSGLARHLEHCLSSKDALESLAGDALKYAALARDWAIAAEECAESLGLAPSSKDHSQFDMEWLRLREPADHRARNRQLLANVQHWADHHGGDLIRITDLGAGAGSNGAFLRDELRKPQHWVLLDQDRHLLDRATCRLRGNGTTVEAVLCKLDAENLDTFIPSNTDLVTASALIDLVSERWLEALVSAASNRRAAVYIVISYAGDFRLMPEHPDDGFIRSLVNEHQHGVKGVDAALGPDATHCLATALKAVGYNVSVAPSPWELKGPDADLQAALISGWADAAEEQSPEDATRIRRWQSSRLSAAAGAELTVWVDHEDLFAWPGDD